MRVKTPQTITSFPRDKGVIVYNYLTKGAVSCSPSDTYWLTVAPYWKSVDEIAAQHPLLEPAEIQEKLMTFVDCDILLKEGTPQALQEESYTRSWELGPAVGLFHFTALNTPYMELAESVETQKQRAMVDPSPQLFRRNVGSDIALSKPQAKAGNNLIKVMADRRTNRDVTAEAISIEELGDCLYSGLGITGFVQTETSLLPLKMTPSGGGRNPYEAYVWARNVHGLASGFYHYSALDHSLGSLSATTNIAPGNFLGGQDWADQMPAIIFLIAEIKRTTWKYNDPNSYRVVLIEAGHIAQNIMLTCTSSGLTACPTAALSHNEISNLFDLDGISQTPIYALAIGRPQQYPDEVISRQVVRNRLNQ
jgi:SagB-type dehydrogenase family enzyme